MIKKRYDTDDGKEELLKLETMKDKKDIFEMEDQDMENISNVLTTIDGLEHLITEVHVDDIIETKTAVVI